MKKIRHGWTQIKQEVVEPLLRVLMDTEVPVEQRGENRESSRIDTNIHQSRTIDY
jgi:hypothetical protein